MKTYFILLLFIFFNVLLFSQNSFTDIPDTDGLSEFTAYQIWDIYHLKELGDSIDASMDPDFSTWHFNKHFRLMQDLIEPLTESLCWAPFRAHFYGNSKKITASIVYDYITNPYSSPAVFSAILFGYSIDGLIVEGYVNDGFAVIVDYNNGIISNCINNAMITSWSAGGITYTNRGTISNCINNGDITGMDNIGGIAGQNLGTITDCINTGQITATNSGSQPNGAGGVGGIVGLHSPGSVYNCVNLGSVEGKNNVGGISGFSSGGIEPATITNCINYGFIKGIDKVGGICGTTSYLSFPNATVTNSVNVGVVEGEEDIGSIVGKE
ncbi:MAG: hypothetical protein FWG85_06870 [Bacteroidetes bacterium]|nr:hypothetical protein [Bacteroidota bacterium]